jgi:hypothetical protein
MVRRTRAPVHLSLRCCAYSASSCRCKSAAVRAVPTTEGSRSIILITRTSLSLELSMGASALALRLAILAAASRSWGPKQLHARSTSSCAANNARWYKRSVSGRISCTSLPRASRLVASIALYSSIEAWTVAAKGTAHPCAVRS